MKVIFLDIDGVLNDDCCALSGPDDVNCPRFLRLAPRALDALKKIVWEADWAKVVLTSTWRIGVRTRHVVQAVLYSHYIHTYIGETCQGFDGNRGEQIAHWLREHPEVEGFVIIDDEVDYDIKQVEGLESHCVRTSFHEGGSLSESNVSQCLRILKQPNEFSGKTAE